MLLHPHRVAWSSALSDPLSSQMRAASVASTLHRRISASNRGLSWRYTY